MNNFVENHGILQENGNDISSFNFPKGFLELISIANVETTLDSFNVFLHTCALNVGFLPENIAEEYVYAFMPDGWKATGAWKFKYWHKSCPGLTCYMTCIPFYSYVTVHGAIDNGTSQNTIYLKMKTTDYLNEHNGPKIVEEFFKNTRSLERKFKDGFCYSLLAELQEVAGCAPTFGFCAAVDEVKINILRLLPVESVVAMSRVNKECNRVASSPLLWKHLVRRDFGLVDDQSASSDESYKQLYKTEYMKRKRTRRTPFLSRQPNPFSYPFLLDNPHSYVDPRIDLDPALQRAFPNLRDRFRPNSSRLFHPLFNPYDNFPGWFH